MPLPIMRAMSTEEGTCYLQSVLDAHISEQVVLDGNLLRVVLNRGAQASVDFKGKTLSPQTRFLFKKLKSPATNFRDFRVQLQWQAKENCYLAAVGKSLVIESTDHPSQPKYEFIVNKARPSHAFMFKNAACFAQDPDSAYINSDENGCVFMGPGSNDNPEAWVNIIFPDGNNNTVNAIDGALAHAHTESIGDVNCSPNSVIKSWRARENTSFCEMLSYV